MHVNSIDHYFDLALADLGFDRFGDRDTFHFSLKRENGNSLMVSLFRDRHVKKLRVSIYTSNIVPQTVSRRFFGEFTRAALEPFRDGIGVGIPEDSERICVYYSLPVENYTPGASIILLEAMLKQVEKWDALLFEQ